MLYYKDENTVNHKSFAETIANKYNSKMNQV